MNGLPSASLQTMSTASRGSGPAIDSNKLRICRGSNGASFRCVLHFSCRRNSLSVASSDRNAATTDRYCLGCARFAQRRFQCSSSFNASSSAHWQSSRITTAGRSSVPTNRSNVTSASTLRISPNRSGASVPGGTAPRISPRFGSTATRASRCSPRRSRNRSASRDSARVAAMISSVMPCRT